MLVLGGVHGDEQAGWRAADRIGGWKPDRGVLLVISRVNRLAIDNGTRTVPEVGDVNRAYSGAAAVTPAEQLAEEIVKVLDEYQVTLWIDLHEAEDFHRRRPDSLGQTLLFADNAASADLALTALERINRRLPDAEQRFSLPAHPVAGSGAEYVGRTRNIAAFTVETAALQPLVERVKQHCIVAEELMATRGMRVAP